VSHLSLAKLRARRRQRTSGAIIFIVAMTLAVLASIGLYALSASSVELKTSGYGRQNAQTHYLSEYGTIAAANDMNGTNAQLYLGLMTSSTFRDQNCTSLMGIDMTTASNLSKSCRRMGAAELQGVWGSGVNAVDAFVGGKAGSLGPFPLTGDFYVELTDPAQAPAPAGYDVNLHLCFAKFTVSAVGITEPDQNIIKGMPQTAFYAAQGLETSRSRVSAGPVRCPQ
jgi:hypothetical protein